MYDPIRKYQRGAYLAGFCKGLVHTWNWSKKGATQEDYDKIIKIGPRGIWRHIKVFFDEFYN